MPIFNFVSQRTILVDHAAKAEDRDCEFEAAHKDDAKSDPNSPPPICENGLKAYWMKEKMKSIDGLPSLTFAPISGVPPVHAPPEKKVEPAPEQTSSPQKAQVAIKIAGSVLGSGLSREEVVRLVFAFSLGLAVAAVYVKHAGITGC